MPYHALTRSSLYYKPFLIVLDWFMSVNVLIEPKPIASLVDLWDYMFSKQATLWQYMGSTPNDLKPALDELMELGGSSWETDEVRADIACFFPHFTLDHRFMSFWIRSAHFFDSGHTHCEVLCGPDHFSI